MWRNTMMPVRIYVVDARALIPVMIFMLHWRLSTLYLAGAGIALFTILEWFGLTFPAARRTIRRYLVGRIRPAFPSWKKRRFA
jgi:intracellular multiplication protein IcmT